MLNQIAQQKLISKLHLEIEELLNQLLVEVD